MSLEELINNDKKERLEKLGKEDAFYGKNPRFPNDLMYMNAYNWVKSDGWRYKPDWE